jgi:hypothetical protein
MKSMIRCCALMSPVAALVLLAVAPAQAQCPAPGAPIVELDETNFTTNTTLFANTVYVLEDIVEVKSGATLTIQPGTCIFGNAQAEPSALVVRQGGRIVAAGTPSAPIVFASANNTEFFNVGLAYQDNPGNPADGDWGGIVIIGEAFCNGATDETNNTDGVPGDCEVEGLNGNLPGLEGGLITDANGVPRVTFGGNDPADDSGVLQYVRIENGGFNLTADNELNGVTLLSVGSGTVIDHIHVKGGLDDGVELFGGSVNLKFVVVTGVTDDSFDFSYGWNGKLQFLVIQQPLASNPGANFGFEADNNEVEVSGSDISDYELTPLTTPQIYNVTMIGGFHVAGGSGEDTALLLRRGVGGKIFNVLAANWETGIDVVDAATFNGCNDTASGDLFVDNVTVSDGTLVTVVPATFQDVASEGVCTGPNVGQGITALTAAAENRTSPGFQPLASIGAAATPPSDGFFDTSATYRGAISPAGTPFYALGTWVNF